MARPLRIEYPGALYHVISRGSEKKIIFVDLRDRAKFLALLEECCERFGVIIYCYVLMGNHYHLLIETPHGDLSKVMHWLNAYYASYFNHRHKRSGPLFQGRYKGILVDKDRYFLQLSRYIHLNPFMAGLVSDPAAYTWSTYRAYLGAARPAKWVNYFAILSMFGEDLPAARGRYREYINQGVEGEPESPLQDLYGQVILGDKAFVERIKKLIDRDAISPEIPENRKFTCCLDAGLILAAVEESFPDTRDRRQIKGVKGCFGRKLALYLLKKYTHLSNQEITALFGDLHYSSISKQCRRFEQELQENPWAKEQMSNIVKRLQQREDEIEGREMEPDEPEW